MEEYCEKTKEERVHYIKDFFGEEYVNKNITFRRSGNKIIVKREFRDRLYQMYKEFSSSHVEEVREKALKMNNDEFIEYFYDEFRREGYNVVGQNLWRIRSTLHNIKNKTFTIESLIKIFYIMDNEFENKGRFIVDKINHDESMKRLQRKIDNLNQ